MASFSIRVAHLALVLCGASLALSSCTSDVVYEYPTKQPGKDSSVPPFETPPGSIFGPGGLSLFGGGDESPGSAMAIPVNSFLWRATLDTLSFMPLASADPFGGVIISDWFAPPESTNERFKMTVYILSRELRSDGLRVAIFRQQRDASGIWVDSEVSPDTASELEITILTRARELRVASLVQ